MEAPSEAVGAASSRYEILARLATGGMAELYLARATDPAGGVRHVVLKRILPSRSHDPQFVTMFIDEARLAIQLHHPNIAQVFDIGRLGSSYFFTMEYIHGENARTVLQRVHGLRRKVPVGHAITIAAGAAAGLNHAHNQHGLDDQPLGIVHRDVSPANIMISYDGEVKLVDFGVAKAAQRFSETRAGTIKGKIAYLSPEQCTGNRPVDRRSDVFSLGIVLYELLTVQRLFRRDNDFTTMAAIVTDDVPPPSRHRPDIPTAIDEVVMTALAKQPDDRFATAGVMVDALEAAAARSSVILSAGGLGAYLRELFGVRPEPWIELDSIHQHPAPVTVTGESMISLPADSSISGAAMWGGHQLPEPLIGEIAEIEAALIRTVKLQAVPPPDDDDFLSTRPERKLAEAIEDRPTVIDERAPDMPYGSDLDETTPVEPMDAVTPPTAITALHRPPRAPSPAAGSPATLAAVPPPRVLSSQLPRQGTLPPPIPLHPVRPTPPQVAVQHTPPLQAVQHTPPLQPIHTPQHGTMLNAPPPPPHYTPQAGMAAQLARPSWQGEAQTEAQGQPIAMPPAPTAHPGTPGAGLSLASLRFLVIIAGLAVIVIALLIRAAIH